MTIQNKIASTDLSATLKHLAIAVDKAKITDAMGHARRAPAVRSATGRLCSGKSRMILAALSAILLVGSMSAAAQAKGKKIYVCTSTTKIPYCRRHDSIGRCTRVGWKRVCTAWQSHRVSSMKVSPGGMRAKKMR